MRSAYRGLALLICLGVVVQAAAVAFGWFDVLKDVEEGAVFTEDTDWNAGLIAHSIVGMAVIPLLGLIMLVLSFFTTVGGASKWAGIVLGTIAFQVAIAIVSFGAPIAGVLHGLNAFVLFGVALMAARRMEAAAPSVAEREHASV